MSTNNLSKFQISVEELRAWAEELNDRAVELYHQEQGGQPLTEKEFEEYRRAVFVGGIIMEYAESSDDMSGESMLDFGKEEPPDSGEYN